GRRPRRVEERQGAVRDPIGTRLPRSGQSPQPRGREAAAGDGQASRLRVRRIERGAGPTPSGSESARPGASHARTDRHDLEAAIVRSRRVLAAAGGLLASPGERDPGEACDADLRCLAGGSPSLARGAMVHPARGQSASRADAAAGALRRSHAQQHQLDPPLRSGAAAAPLPGGSAGRELVVRPRSGEGPRALAGRQLLQGGASRKSERDAAISLGFVRAQECEENGLRAAHFDGVDDGGQARLAGAQDGGAPADAGARAPPLLGLPLDRVEPEQETGCEPRGGAAMLSTDGRGEAEAPEWTMNQPENIVVQRIESLDEALLAPLVRQSAAEGYRHLERLVEEWKSGGNRFDSENEALFVAVLADAASGVL